LATTAELRGTLAAHFRAPARQSVVRALVEFPNFFEGWFTAEALFALRCRWPDATLSSNANHGGFPKPDVVFSHEGLTAVLALKHISTLHRDAQSRWDGVKGSTVAKDISGLRAVQSTAVTTRALVFYGPGYRTVHEMDGACERNRLFCISCSVRHLSHALIAAGGQAVTEPEIETLLDDGSFHLLEFAP
jgi:hypothetical protein